MPFASAPRFNCAVKLDLQIGLRAQADCAAGATAGSVMLLFMRADRSLNARRLRGGILILARLKADARRGRLQARAAIDRLASQARQRSSAG
jgi:hypothetical protein